MKAKEHSWVFLLLGIPVILAVVWFAASQTHEHDPWDVAKVQSTNQTATQTPEPHWLWTRGKQTDIWRFFRDYPSKYDCITGKLRWRQGLEIGTRLGSRAGDTTPASRTGLRKRRANQIAICLPEYKKPGPNFTR